MKASRILATVLALAAFLISAEAASKKKSGPKVVAVHGGTDETIESVSSNSITVKHGKNTQTFEINGSTEILIDHRKSTPADLKQGMRAIVRASSLNPQAAQSISVDDPSAKAPTPAKSVTPKKSAPKKK